MTTGRLFVFILPLRELGRMKPFSEKDADLSRIETLNWLLRCWIADSVKFNLVESVDLTALITAGRLTSGCFAGGASDSRRAYFQQRYLCVPLTRHFIQTLYL